MAKKNDRPSESDPRLPRTMVTHGLAGLAGALILLVCAWVGWMPSMPPPAVGVAGSSLDPVRTPPSAYRWTDSPAPEFPLPPYSRFLKGVRIVLDPGHVGQVDKGGTWKRGPGGTREADVNLRVTKFLREFLESAGAEVRLTRDRDVSLGLPDHEDLRQRAEVANQWRADLLLSIHHNGVDDPRPNYTSVFYHAGPDHSPASLTAARHVLQGLNDVLRLESHLECGVISDYAIYRTDGFRVLRLSEVPAVLSEASFLTNPEEERRLSDPVYNRREAYGLFLGLARWAQAGLPRVRLIEPASGRLERGKPVVISLDDGLSARGGFGARTPKILPDSLIVKLGGQSIDVTANWARREIRFVPPASTIGKPTRLYIDFTTILGQHVLHPIIDLNVPPATARRGD